MTVEGFLRHSAAKYMKDEILYSQIHVHEQGFIWGDSSKGGHAPPFARISAPLELVNTV